MLAFDTSMEGFLLFEEVQAAGQLYPREDLDAFSLLLFATVAVMLLTIGKIE